VVGLNPGVLKDRISITELSLDRTPRGGSNAAKVHYLTTRAQVKPIRPTSANQDGKFTITQPFEVLIRNNKSKPISETMIATYNGNSYAIQNVRPADSRGRYTVFQIIRQQ
jgi:SPP1 family predicted phage head-tail adaptor